MTDKKISFKAVLFDLDGTLLDTLRDIADSANSALRQLGFATHDTETYKYFVGDGIEELVKRALPESCRDTNTIARYLELVQKEYHRNWAIQSKPYEGVKEMLDELQRRNIPMAVLSNKPHEFTCLMVDEILGDYDFEIVRGAGPDAPVKPAPNAALQIAKQMKMPPAQFVYVGDGSTDMQAANAAGMYAVGALWGYRTADELTRAGARILIERPGEVMTLFGADN
jgi:phosphoglycolate phosphatase